MNMAIAVEVNSKDPEDYKVWYLEINPQGDVIGIGVKHKEELIQDLFQSYRASGKSHWRVFCQNAEESKAIEAYDFISKNSYENTHFGNLPTLNDFQKTLDSLQSHLELRSIA